MHLAWKVEGCAAAAAEWGRCKGGGGGGEGRLRRGACTMRLRVRLGGKGARQEVILWGKWGCQGMQGP